MKNSIETIKIIVLIIFYVLYPFSCNQQKTPHGIYKGKIGEYSYRIDFRDDGSILLEKFNTLHAGILIKEIGTYDMIIERFNGIWEFDDEFIKVIINDDIKSEMIFSFDRNDLINTNSKERFVKDIIN